MRHSSDVADQETVDLPAIVQHVGLEPDTLLDVSATLFIPTSNTPREICIATLVALTPPLIEASPPREEVLPHFCPSDNILGVTGNTSHLYTMQTLRPTQNLLDTLITIEHLCKLFLLQRGSPPLEISLHWLVCLELMAYGHCSFYFALPDDDAAAFNRPVQNAVCIPFVASLNNSEHLILVRGK
ncbi:hypothetical protein [Dictyobacter formicarum]|nr:hypothetical protein [Dictyobacter formicarum]